MDLDYSSSSEKIETHNNGIPVTGEKSRNDVEEGLVAVQNIGALDPTSTCPSTAAAAAGVTSDDDVITSSSSSSPITDGISPSLTSGQATVRATNVRRSRRQQLACQHELLVESVGGAMQLQQQQDDEKMMLTEWSDFTTIARRGPTADLTPTITRERRSRDRQMNESESASRHGTATSSSNDHTDNRVVEKKDVEVEMESGFESDPDDDRNSAAAAASTQVVSRDQGSSSSIDELIKSLMMPPPPPAPASDTPPVLDAITQLAHLLRAPPPPRSPVLAPATRQRSPPPTARPQRGADPKEDIYAELVIPPPPPSTERHAKDDDVDAFLAKIVACNGVAVPGKVGHAPLRPHKPFSRQISLPTDQQRLMCSSQQRHVCTENGSSRFHPLTFVDCDEAGSVFHRYGTLPSPSSMSSRPPRLDRRDIDVAGGGTLTRGGSGRRRPPPPPPPRRTSSVQSSPALSCRSEQLGRRGVPPRASLITHRGDLARPLDRDTITPLIRPGAVRSSFSTPTQPTTSPGPPSPDWNVRRSNSLTESATKPPGRPSLLASIGSRLRSYWSPAKSLPRDGREPSPGSHRRTSTDGGPRRQQDDLRHGSSTPLSGLLLPDDLYSDLTGVADCGTSRQLHASATTSSFTSFTGEPS